MEEERSVPEEAPQDEPEQYLKPQIDDHVDQLPASTKAVYRATSWLAADWEIPQAEAPREKLWSRTTSQKTFRAFRFTAAPRILSQLEPHGLGASA